MKNFLKCFLLTVGGIGIAEGDVLIGLILIAGAILWEIYFPTLSKTEEHTRWIDVVSNCPFCGTPYEKWNTVSSTELRICCHCKRHCYRDGSTVGQNAEDIQTLADEAEDCQRVAAGTYDNECRSIISIWHSRLHAHKSATFTIRLDHVNLWHGHTDLTRTPKVHLYPHLKTYAGRQALARRMHPFIEEALGDSAKFYLIDSSGDVVCVDDDFENYLKRQFSDT